MPVHPVKKNREIVGWQWGGKGKIYTGQNARARAMIQGRAAYAGGYRGKNKA